MHLIAFFSSDVRLMADLSFFNHFEGRQDCGIASTDVYIPPIASLASTKKHSLYCPNRAKLLEAMSGGGRHGFDTPYFPLGCHFRWYSTAEICMILDRFDSIVFLGDNTLRHIYSAFNMLLRENIALGGLRQWEMKESEREACRCENQLTRLECLSFSVLDSQSVRSNDAGTGHSSPYLCDRTSFRNPIKCPHNSIRYTSCIYSYRSITGRRGPACIFQLHIAARTGFVQANRRYPFVVTCYISSLVNRHVING